MSSDTFDRLNQTQRVSLKYLEISSYCGLSGGITRYTRQPNAVTLEALDRYGKPTDGRFAPPANDFFCINLMEAAPLTACNVLELKGLDVSKVIKPSFHSPLWRCLGSLAFESCFALKEALTLITGGKNQYGQPLLSELRLHSLRIRHDGDTTTDQQFKAKLRDFIISLPGLVNLSVLLESDDKPPLDFMDILVTHGTTLRRLVLEERRLYGGPFEPSDGDESPSARQLRQVSQFCRNLVELGITLDWTKLPYSVRSSSHK